MKSLDSIEKECVKKLYCWYKEILFLFNTYILLIENLKYLESNILEPFEKNINEALENFLFEIDGISSSEEEKIQVLNSIVLFRSLINETGNYEKSIIKENLSDVLNITIPRIFQKHNFLEEI